MVPLKVRCYSAGRSGLAVVKIPQALAADFPALKQPFGSGGTSPIENDYRFNHTIPAVAGNARSRTPGSNGEILKGFFPANRRVLPWTKMSDQQYFLKHSSVPSDFLSSVSSVFQVYGLTLSWLRPRGARGRRAGISTFGPS